MRRSVGDRQNSAQTSHRRCNVMHTELAYIDLGCGHSLEAKKPKASTLVLVPLVLFWIVLFCV